MLIHPAQRPIKAQTLVVDLISYSGSPKKGNLSPYQGMLQILRDQIRSRGHTMDLDHVIENLGTLSDYDADKQHPIPGKYVKHEELPEKYLTRLEDIDPSWVAQYITNVLTGYKFRNGGLGANKYASGSNGVWTDSEGEVRQITDLAVDMDATYGYDIHEAKSKLPYLLKRLHQKSIDLGCSLISIYGRYLCVKVGTATPKPSHILATPIYQMDKSGHVTAPYPPTANHNKGFPEALQFVSGAYPNDPYYKDLLEFGQVCSVLGIKLWCEDPKEYDQDFINSLTVTYIASNKDFLWNGRKIDGTVLSALSTTSVKDFKTDELVNASAKYESFAERIGDNPIFRRPELSYNSIKKLLALYTLANDEDKTFGEKNRHLHTCNGFICAPGSDTPHLFNTDKFCENKGKYALLHYTGLFVQYSTSSPVKVLSSDKAMVYLSGSFRMRLTNRAPEGWGQWDSMDT